MGEKCVCVCGGGGGGGDYLYPPRPIAACLPPADRPVSSSSMLLCVHRDPTVSQGRVTQDVHLDFHTALSSNPCRLHALRTLQTATSGRQSP